MKSSNLEMRIQKAEPISALGKGLLATAISFLPACGTMLYTQQGGQWYECNTTNKYPAAHPCYGPVQEHRSKQIVATPREKDYQVDRHP